MLNGEIVYNLADTKEYYTKPSSENLKILKLHIVQINFLSLNWNWSHILKITLIHLQICRNQINEISHRYYLMDNNL